MPGLNRVALFDTHRKRDALLRTLPGEQPVGWRSSPMKVPGDRAAGAVPTHGEAAQPLRVRETYRAARRARLQRSELFLRNLTQSAYSCCAPKGSPQPGATSGS